MDEFELFLVALFAQSQPAANPNEIAFSIRHTMASLSQRPEITPHHLNAIRMLSELVKPSACCTPSVFIKIALAAFLNLNFDNAIQDIRNEQSFDGPLPSKSIQ